MLVLTRKKDESIIIADDIEISIVDISKGHVKIGINAPAHITIHRKEVYDSIKAENVRAALVSASDVSRIKDIFNLSEEDDD